MRYFKKFTSYDFSLFRLPMYSYSKESKEKLLKDPLVALLFLVFAFMPENHPEPEHVKKEKQKLKPADYFEAMEELKLFAMQTLHDFNTKIYLELYLLDKFGEKAEKAFDLVREVPKTEENHSQGQTLVVLAESDSEALDPSNDDTLEMGSLLGDNEEGEALDIQTELSII